MFSDNQIDYLNTIPIQSPTAGAWVQAFSIDSQPLISEVYTMKLITLFGLLALLAGCTQDQQNQLSRKMVEFLDGNYLVTYANGSTSKTWTIRNGKVTTTDKGYYYFWDEKKHYVQTPIENTFIEEI
jgi:hypothetical protein